jgi:mannosyltransferase OCH1-like enzyme
MEKIIHQIWIGESEMPNREKEYVKMTKELNPSYHQILWYDGNIPKLPEKFKEIYDRHYKRKDWVQCADLLRQYLVYEMGGIYIDVDYEPLKPLNCLKLDSCDGFLYHGGDEDLNISNSMFGFKSKHPISTFVYETIIKDESHWFGPTWMGKVIKSYFGLDYKDLTSKLESKMDKNLKFIYVRELDKVMLHKSLYSWSPENYPKYKPRNQANPFK